MPKKALWAIAALLAGILVITFRAERYPARVVVINHSGRVAAAVVLQTETQRFDVGVLRAGESRILKVEPAPKLELSYTTDRDRRWTSPQPLTAAQSVVLYITPTGQVDPHIGLAPAR